MLSLLLVGCTTNKIQINTNQDSDTYIVTDDYQNFLDLYSCVVKSDKGYYYITNNVLTFYDNEMGKSYPVCNKINCDHLNDECSAYLSPINFYPGQLGYYNGDLYVLGWTIKQANVRENYLYQISLKDFKRKKVTYLFDSSGIASCSFLVHRGYVYYALGGGVMQNRSVQLYRAELGNLSKKNDNKVIYEFTGIGAEIFSLSAYGNNVYFNTMSYADESGNGYKKSLHSLNIHTLQSNTVIDDNKYSYFVDNNKIYYQKNYNEINCIDLKTNSDDFFCNVDKLCYISADDNYVFFDNKQLLGNEDNGIKREISVFDKDGNFVNKIESKNKNDECLFGGNDKLIFKDSTNAINQKYYAVDKSHIKDSNHDFIEFN